MYVFRRTGHASQTLVVLHLMWEGDEHPAVLSVELVDFTSPYPVKQHLSMTANYSSLRGVLCQV